MLSLSKLRIYQRTTNVSSIFKFLSTKPIVASMSEYSTDSVRHVQESNTPTAISTEQFRKLHQINVITKDNHSYDPMVTFEQSPFSDKIKKVFQTEGYTNPTPTQAQSWPIILQKKDLVSIAKTGSGKTCGFLIPAFHMLSLEPKPAPEQFQKSRRNHVNTRTTKILIIAPTRELGVQITNEAEKFARVTSLKTICLYGGVSRSAQIEILHRQGADIVVATPGRANDLIESGYLNLSHVKYFVMDEADRMLDMGFEPQIRQIVSSLPEDRQNIFFTATWPRSVQALANEFLSTPIMLQIGDTNQLNANKDITQSFLVVKPFEKDERLFELLRDINDNPDKDPSKVPKTIIFRSRKHECDMLCEQLYSMGYAADSLHGDKSQAFRDRVMQNFRNGRIRVLVATDVAARGLDVKDISAVVNYDLPDKGVEDYVHRIGRTARGGQKGMSFSFITQKDARSGILTELVALVKRCGQKVPAEVSDMELQFSNKHHSHTGGALGRHPATHSRSRNPAGNEGGGGWKFGNSRPQHQGHDSYGGNSSSFSRGFDRGSSNRSSGFNDDFSARPTQPRFGGNQGYENGSSSFGGKKFSKLPSKYDDE